MSNVHMMNQLSSDGDTSSLAESLGDDTTHSQMTSFSQPIKWLQALKSDDLETATLILQSGSKRYKDFLMNGDIPILNRNPKDPLDQHRSSTYSSMEFCITKPLHAAAIFHSHAVLRLLWMHGVDVQQVDCWHNNVIHMLIYADHMKNARGTKHVETVAYLQGLLSEKELTSLMVAENVLTLRPLEFAAFHCCLNMVGIIMQTKGVYLIKEEQVGYSVEQYFDLSDYELFHDGLPPRVFKSPLIFLIYIEKSRMESPGSEAAFDDPGLKSWMHAKRAINWPFVFIWFLFRFTYVIVFLLASMENSWPSVVDKGNKFNSNATDTEEIVICSHMSEIGRCQWYSLVIVSILILIFDIYEFFSLRSMFHRAVYNMFNSRDLVGHTKFYHVMQFTTCLSVVGISACQISRSKGFAVPLIIDHTLFFYASFGCIWGVVYFLQVLPWISIYAIAVQRMLQDFVRFTLIFVIFLCAFAISFRRILLGDSNVCPKDFENLGETIYSSFLLIINLINFREYPYFNKTSLYCLHIVFVFFISILLVNFLIATMTQSFSDVHAKRRAIMQIQRLMLMMTIQIRFGRPLQALYRKLQSKAFVYHNKRLCLRRTLLSGESFEPTLLNSGGNITWKMPIITFLCSGCVDLIIKFTTGLYRLSLTRWMLWHILQSVEMKWCG